jgi:predicted  nucleic acid-binding Zn-ribbon protein
MAETADIRILTSELVKRLNEDTRRIRTLEQRMERFEVSLNALEENFETQMQEIKKTMEQINTGIKSISEKIVFFENEFQRVNKELEKRATKMEVKEIQNYMSLMGSINTKFATKEETK